MEAALTSPAHTSGAPDQSLGRKIAALCQRTWARCTVLALFGLAVHFPSLQGQLIWGDLYLARDNPFIKSPLLVLESFRHHLFLDSFSAHYRPVQNISYIFDYLVWNTDPYGFHLSNLFWHIGSGILLYLLFRKFLKGFAAARLDCVVAFFAALIWVIHPVHSAAVDYISGRADSLAFFFAAAGWLLFWKTQRVSCAVWRLSLYTLAATCGMLALLSREIACIWIVLFIAYLLWVEE